MRILHLSTSDIGGGAARAAFRLHTGLQRLGHDSQMLVLQRTSGEASVRKMEWSQDFFTRLRRARRRKQIARDRQPYIPPPVYFDDDRTEAGYDLVRQLPPCDLINLHWVNGFVDYEVFFSHLPARAAVVWRLADMSVLTGGCHYDGGCGKFKARCGACPVLHSDREHDLSRDVWERKSRSLGKLPPERLHLVGTSRWIAAQAKASRIFSRFPTTIIPNGLDVELFRPMDKAACRAELGISAQARVVLFVADSAAHVRKGFAYLAAALEKLAAEPDLFLLSVGGGKPAVPNLPQLHLGKIHDDRRLARVYSAADVFVIPSLQESFGQTVIESMACGTPVVGFDTGGIPDMVRPGVTGYLAPVGDVAGLAQKIHAALHGSNLTDACRQIAVAEYSLDVQARAYEQLYRTILSGGGSVIRPANRELLPV